jgi:hypothetical protein
MGKLKQAITNYTDEPGFWLFVLVAVVGALGCVLQYRL